MHGSLSNFLMLVATSLLPEYVQLGQSVVSDTGTAPRRLLGRPLAGGGGRRLGVRDGGDWSAVISVTVASRDYWKQCRAAFLLRSSHNL